MYISRVMIDYSNIMNIRKLGNLTSYHKWIEESFPDEINSNKRSRKLWRIDRINDKSYLLLVSEEKPDLEKLEKFGVKGSGETKEYSKFLGNIEVGEKAKFKITLNPVVSIKDENSDRGKVVSHVTVAQQLKYLKDRAEKNGFSLKDDEFYITERSYENFKKGDGKRIRLSKVSYEGILTVTDKERMINTLINGFGKKKAYGFGLMTLIMDH